MWFAPWTMKEFLKELFSEYAGLIFLFIIIIGCVCWGFYHEMEKERLNMETYIKKPVVIKAVQWFEDGDHPDVKKIEIGRSEYREHEEGRCKQCLLVFDGIHGEIETPAGLEVVCPGDFIIVNLSGEKCPCNPDIFKMMFNKVEVE